MVGFKYRTPAYSVAMDSLGSEIHNNQHEQGGQGAEHPALDDFYLSIKLIPF